MLRLYWQVLLIIISVVFGLALFFQSVWAAVIMADWITMEPLYTKEWTQDTTCDQESWIIGNKVNQAETIVNNIKYKLINKYGYLADEIDEIIVNKENELSSTTEVMARVELSKYIRKFKLLKKSFIISDIYRQDYYDQGLFYPPTVDSSQDEELSNDLKPYQEKLNQMITDKKLLEEGYGLASLKAEIENYIEINNTMKEIGCGQDYFYDECIMECREEITCRFWIFSNWSPCFGGQQTRAIIVASPEGCRGGAPVLSRPCQTDVTSDNTVEVEKRLITQIDHNLVKRLAGRILLQVEEKGKGWYVYPDDLKKYYLGRPGDAFNIMRELGLGATHDFITAHIFYPNYVLGRILLDVEDNGKAYYIYPQDRKAYYLGRPEDAFQVMRNLGLGITNEDIRKIDVGETG